MSPNLGRRLRPRLRFDAFELDPVRGRLLRDGAPVELRPKAFRLLLHLAENGERVVTKAELLERLWPDGGGTEANLTVCVATVRRALGDDRRDPRYVVTVPTVGYRFTEVPRPVFDADPGHEVARIARLGMADFRWYDEEGPARTPGAASVETPRDDRTPLSHAVARALARLEGLEIVALDRIAPTEAETSGSEPDTTDRDVDTVLEGEIRRRGESLRVELGIWSEADRRRLWRHRLSLPLAEAHALPVRITRTLVHALRPAPRTLPLPGVQPAHDTSAAAEHFCDEAARTFWGKDTVRAPKLALDGFERALEIDPGLGRAHAGVAEVLLQMWIGGARTEPRTPERIRTHARRALELAPLSADAHRVQGSVRLCLDRDGAGAREHLLAALDFGPLDAANHDRYAFHLAAQDQCRAAVETMQRAVTLDPDAPRLAADLAIMHHFANDLPRALTVLDDLTCDHPDAAVGRLLAAWFRLGAGEVAQALPLLERLVTLLGSGPVTDALIGAGHAAVGDTDLAAHFGRRLDDAEQKGRGVPSLLRAMIPTAAGEVGEAIAHLQRACDEEHGYLPFLEADPFWRPILDHPSAAALRRSVLRARF